jgi:large subunit ribosomal protein L17
MVTSLFKYGQLETTEAKAKQLRPVAEKMVTLAKRGDLHARRQALSFIKEKAVTHRLFNEIKDRYMDRQGGYIRVVKKGYRKGDGAPVSVVQLLATEGDKKKGRKKSKAPAEKQKTAIPLEEKEVKAPEEERTADAKKPVEEKVEAVEEERTIPDAAEIDDAKDEKGEDNPT